MKEQKHTPGPWEVDCRTGCFAVRRRGDKLNCLSEASRDSIVFQNGRSEELSEPNGYRYLTDEQIANAYLIASAPELLEALKLARDFIRNGIEYGYIDTPSQCSPEAQTLGIIVDAIKKAEVQT